MMNAAYVLAVRASDFPFAIESMQVRNQYFPDQKVDAFLKIAGIHASYTKDEAKAQDNYRQAYLASNKSPQVLAQIPAPYQAKL
jgi:hypothetical protein